MTAHYFPVKSTAFRFQAGLHPFGTDFGNGVADRLYFQIDEQRPYYLAEKRRVSAARHRVLERDDDERRGNARVLEWMRATLQHEHPGLFPSTPDTLRGIGAEVQEDLVVIHRRGDGSNAAIGVDVSFPSDWSPERIAGTDFRFIHGPVPGFADSEAQASSMVSAMIDRGPFVRFVWTLKPDGDLDHHPDVAHHRLWSDDDAGFLRVERQVTVPFAAVAAALFLIRTYLYPFDSLSPEQRETIANALKTMPPEAAAYKGFTEPEAILRRLIGGPR